MAVAMSVRAAFCLVTTAPSPGVPIRGDVCRYRVRGSWIIGGAGEVVTPDLLRPVRIFAKDDTMIERPAQVDEPCILTRGQDGTLKLYMLTEVYGETDCEQP